MFVNKKPIMPLFLSGNNSVNKRGSRSFRVAIPEVRKFIKILEFVMMDNFSDKLDRKMLIALSIVFDFSEFRFSLV